MNTVTILGYGWLGQALTTYLQSLNYSVKITKRNLDNFKDNVEAYVWNLGADFPKEAISETIVISIAEQENNIENYIKLYRQLEQFGAKKIIFISSSSIYNDVIGEATETSEILNPTSAVALKEKSLQTTNIPSVILRLSGLVGPNRNPAKFLAGKKNVANPTQKVNLVHQYDVIRFIEKRSTLSRDHSLGRLMCPGHLPNTDECEKKHSPNLIHVGRLKLKDFEEQ